MPRAFYPGDRVSFLARHGAAGTYLTRPTLDDRDRHESASRRRVQAQEIWQIFEAIVVRETTRENGEVYRYYELKWPCGRVIDNGADFCSSRLTLVTR